jgi:hypothetical protein
MNCRLPQVAHDVRIVARQHVGDQVMNGHVADIAETTFLTHRRLTMCLATVS